MRLSLFFAAFLMAGAANAQLTTSLSSANGVTTLTCTIRGDARNLAFAGAPYSAKRVFQTVQTLPEGGKVSSTPVVNSIWQDSAGRLRTEQQYSVMGGGAVSVVQILDPVEGSYYVLDPVLSVAHRVKVTAHVTQVNNASHSAPNIPASTKANNDGSNFSTESLGTRTIQGLSAEGIRTSMHYPAGSPLGNNTALDAVTETWNAPDIGATVLMKSNDPRFGESTTKLEDVIAAEPDASLFRVPAGYTVVDEIGQFQITLSNQ